MPAPAPDPSTRAFKALADPTRCQILQLLAGRDMTIGEVVEHFDMTRAGVKKHLTLLEQGQLISVRKAGRERLNRLNPDGFRAASRWIGYFDRFWTDKLHSLKIAAEKDQEND